jgi:hypothetical protein
MPLSVVVSLFTDGAYARRAIVAMLTDGELALRDPDGLTLSLSQVRELERQPSPWNRHTQYRLALTRRRRAAAWILAPNTTRMHGSA